MLFYTIDTSNIMAYKLDFSSKKCRPTHHHCTLRYNRHFSIYLTKTKCYFMLIYSHLAISNGRQFKRGSWDTTHLTVSLYHTYIRSIIAHIVDYLRPYYYLPNA